jgi:hypothetical protein
MLRPLVRLLLRNGITFPIVADLLRALFVEVASKELLAEARTRTDSRISLMTGVHRKEIKRLRELPPDTESVPEVVTRGSQIIGRWLGMPEYADASGHPRPLVRLAGPDSGPSFDSLVASVTTDVRPRTVLDDWLSQGIVTLDADDVVHLQVRAFIPPPGREEQLFYFARNLQDHIAAAAANISANGPSPFLDRTLHYDGMPPAAAARLEAYAREAGMRVLLEANRLAAELVGNQSAIDNIIVPKRVNFGVYVFSEDEASRSEPTE